MAKLGRNYPDKIWGPEQYFGGLCPPGPNVEPPLPTDFINYHTQMYVSPAAASSSTAIQKLLNMLSVSTRGCLVNEMRMNANKTQHSDGLEHANIQLDKLSTSHRSVPAQLSATVKFCATILNLNLCLLILLF